ncbi:hypothetical protein OG302_00750 [Streptomyces sp. NBC_01283]|uniref:hypothetical protein n=1 Tax=Streptomyces sp. NBC_01283 TaxID=2903812 RepID=UPI00352E598D|nr:hypothetical protein OG302_00750 [Streptomyces sp. NBC_01283]
MHERKTAAEDDARQGRRREVWEARESRALPTPSPRKITGWIMRPRDTLTDHLEEHLLQVRLAGRDITRACDLARVFHELVRHRRGDQLLEWIREAEQDAPAPIRSFAGFLRQDLDAVTAGLTLTYSYAVATSPISRRTCSESKSP